MEVCVFQGTFNPIHNAHLRVAEYVLNNCGINKVTFIPAYEPPHKDLDLLMSHHRLNMVRLAAEENEGFEVSDIEFELGGKSYTYRTICELYKRYKIRDRIKFIIGTDAFEKIESWYETDKLKEKVKFLVFPREHTINTVQIGQLRGKGYDFVLMPLAFEDISSTELRNAVKNSKSLQKFVPKKIEEYIKQNDLYKD